MTRNILNYLAVLGNSFPHNRFLIHPTILKRHVPVYIPD
jgi:hypothetical protein